MLVCVRMHYLQCVHMCVGVSGHVHMFVGYLCVYVRAYMDCSNKKSQ